MDLEAFIGALPGGFAQGLMWGVLALGVYISYKILDFADLTVDGSLATGGAVTAVLIEAGVSPWLSLLAAIAAGSVAGLITALLNTKLKIPAILSGILTMSALYSVNLHILSDRANVSVYGKTTVNNAVSAITGLSVVDDKNYLSIITAVLICTAIIAAMYWFFGTEQGSAIRATGNNPTMAKAQGISTDKSKMIALAMSNGLAALSGSLIAQHNFSADVNMASGTIVIGLAAVVIGELLCKDKNSFWVKLMCVVFGSVIYRLIFTVAVQLGLDTNDLKLIAAVIVVLALVVPRFIKERFPKNKNDSVKEDAANA